MHSMRALLPAFVGIVIVLVPGTEASSQGGSPVDSAKVARRIAQESEGRSPAARARLALYAMIRSGETDQAGELLDFMDAYGASIGASDWVTPAERLLSETLLGDPRLVARTSRLDDLLAGWRGSPRQHQAFQDRLHQRLQDRLRLSVDPVFALLDRWRPDPEDRFFFLILVNHLTISGIRGREQLNDMIDSFAGEFPESPLVRIARERITFVYSERPIGVAVHVGYAVGMFDETLNERYRRFYGPVIGGEFYLWQASMLAQLAIGLADGRRAFQIGGETWPMGESPLISLSLDAGYEVRLGRTAFTPLLGLAIQNLRSADLDRPGGGERPSTGTRLGYDASIQTTYRIAFDRGPHVDLRLRVGRTDTDLESCDKSLAGGLWYVGLGLAIVHRPYIE